MDPPAVEAYVLAWLVERGLPLTLDGVAYGPDEAPARFAGYNRAYLAERRPFYRYLGLVV